MKPKFFITLTTIVLGLSLPQQNPAEADDQRTVDFNRDIRPILASKCFACHGPDEEQREADLRLDDRQAVIDQGAITPGDSDESELIRRLLSDDPDEVMPPADSGTPLTDQQKQLFVDWVNQDAPYDQHWSFVTPTRPDLPEVMNTSWPRNEIDFFVLSRLEQEALQPSPQADRYTLIRRLYLDLIGLPPTPEQADAFVSDKDSNAYEKVVDQLLGSKHYGERWAQGWLDLARYSDTNGYEKDRERSIWPYRDWVIRALNDDMPFDQFTIEQIAGDMLADPTQDQLIATGFHRNTMLNEEGGIDPLEYRFYAMVDRVATTGMVWLGLSTGCAQCHSHKYDPITHTDFYRLMALMDNADEPDMLVKTPDIESERQRIEQQIRSLESTLPDQFPAAEGDSPSAESRRRHLDDAFAAWVGAQRAVAKAWKTIAPTDWETNLPRLEVLDDDSIFSTGDVTKRDVFKLRFPVAESDLPISAIRIEAIADERLPDGGPGRAYYEGRKGTYFLSELDATFNGQTIEFTSTSQSNPAKNADKAVLDDNGSSGWSGPIGETHQLIVNLKKNIQSPGQLQVEMLFERHFVASLGRFRFALVSADAPVSFNHLPVEIESILAQEKDSLSDAQRQQLFEHFLRVTPLLAEARKPIEALRKRLPQYPATMVMSERPNDNPRITHRHHRGEFLSPRETVEPGIVEFLAGESGQQPVNRLQFAGWLVSDKNPLVSRVTVNRAWQAFFGQGLHLTSDDFGTQTEPPSHPQLLDWLASEFVQRGWSMKQLHRLIVTSATYRQSSQLTPELLRLDSQNRLLARGPRFRANAEVVRDMMLHSSGLLSEKMYGPGVRPPQPQSVTAVAYGNPKWNPSSGEDRYRRSIYTFSKRTAPFAAFSVFDAPSGENCVARRDRSNTPLQALTLLNDQMFLEMARALAEDVSQANSSDADALVAMFRRILTRPPTQNEQTEIMQFYREQLSRLESGELNAPQITALENGSNRQAAWTIVARALMNLDEAITKS